MNDDCNRNKTIKLELKKKKNRSNNVKCAFHINYIIKPK